MVPCVGVPAGQAIVADTTIALTVLWRDGMHVFASDADQDDFHPQPRDVARGDPRGFGRVGACRGCDRGFDRHRRRRRVCVECGGAPSRKS